MSVGTGRYNKLGGINKQEKILPGKLIYFKRVSYCKEKSKLDPISKICSYKYSLEMDQHPMFC